MTYDQWKLRSPEDDVPQSSWFPEVCPKCGSRDEYGPSWDSDGERVDPYGWCSECGWRCEACPDIQDLYERCEG